MRGAVSAERRLRGVHPNLSRGHFFYRSSPSPIQYMDHGQHSKTDAQTARSEFPNSIYTCCAFQSFANARYRRYTRPTTPMAAAHLPFHLPLFPLPPHTWPKIRQLHSSIDVIQQLLRIRVGPGALILPKDVTKISMEFHKKYVGGGHYGARYAPYLVTYRSWGFSLRFWKAEQLPARAGN